MKTAQISQIFIYVISILIVGLILYYGYTHVKGFGKKEEELSFITFKNSLDEAIHRISSDYGTMQIKEFEVPAKYTKVCLVTSDWIERYAGSQDIEIPGSELSEGEKFIITDSISGGSKNNVFLFPDGTAFSIETRMEVEDFVKCFESSRNKITIRIEGLGNRARISRARASE